MINPIINEENSPKAIPFSDCIKKFRKFFAPGFIFNPSNSGINMIRLYTVHSCQRKDRLYELSILFIYNLLEIIIIFVENPTKNYIKYHERRESALVENDSVTV